MKRSSGCTWARDDDAPTLTVGAALTGLGAIEDVWLGASDSYSWGPGDQWWVTRLELSIEDRPALRVALFAESRFSKPPELDERELALDRWVACDGGDAPTIAAVDRALRELGYRREDRHDLPTLFAALSHAPSA